MGGRDDRYLLRLAINSQDSFMVVNDAIEWDRATKLRSNTVVNTTGVEIANVNHSTIQTSIADDRLSIFAVAAETLIKSINIIQKETWDRMRVDPTRLVTTHIIDTDNREPVFTATPVAIKLCAGIIPEMHGRATTYLATQNDSLSCGITSVNNSAQLKAVVGGFIDGLRQRLVTEKRSAKMVYITAVLISSWFRPNTVFINTADDDTDE